MRAPRTIHISWEGPVSLQAAQNLNDWSRDFGVYQVYGAHPVYGPNVLLYIGRSEKRSFGERFREHQCWLDSNQDKNQLQIYVGRLHTYNSTPDNQEWERQIREAESLLIYAHGPTANSSGLNATLGEDYFNLHILNWGQYKALLPEVSGARYSTKFWDKAGFKPYLARTSSAP
jgi:hypothetical protein